MWARRLLRHALALSLTALLGTLLAATLVRLAPGYGVDERELDTRLAESSIQALRQARDHESLPVFYQHYLAGLWHGNLGISRSLGRPVAELFGQRAAPTLRLIGLGVTGGWLLGFMFAVPGVINRGATSGLLTTLLSGLVLCVPSSALALLFVYFHQPASVALALVIFPRIQRYARNLFLKTSTSPHVLAAHARGIFSVHIFFYHVLRPAAPTLIALMGTSISLAFGASIPIEVICDLPGIGQLAWQAALARDLPLLVNVTLFATLSTLVANFVSDLARAGLPGGAA